MKKILSAAILSALSCAAALAAGDWANFGRYAEANKAVSKPPLAVLMGDSITDAWPKKTPDGFFAKNNIVGRGISGQVTSQMLARFRRDVLDLKPKYVAILAGTNDIAQNQGYIAVENVFGNIVSMVEIAKANGVIPIVCSVLPANKYPWRQEIKPAPLVKKLNEMLKAYCEKNSVKYVDYYTPMADDKDGLPKKYANDGIHPTPEGYVVMEKILLPELK